MRKRRNAKHMKYDERTWRRRGRRRMRGVLREAKRMDKGEDVEGKEGRRLQCKEESTKGE